MSERATVLVVDDTEAVRWAVERALSRSGYRVLTACSGEDALSVCDRELGAITLFLVDLTLPGMSGLELIEELRVRRPKTAVLAMSGNDRESMEGTGVAFIQKPFGVTDLLARIRDTLLPGNSGHSIAG